MIRLVAAFFRRDFLQDVSYRLAFVWQVMTLFFSVAILYFLARMMETPPPSVAAYGGGYFTFSLIGFAIAEMCWSAMSSFAQRVRQDQVVGTLEAMMASSPLWNKMVLASGSYSAAFALVRGAVLLSGAALLGAALPPMALLRCLPILILVLAGYAALGVVSAAFTLVLKRGDPVAAFFGLTTFLLGGTLYPLSALPEWLRGVAQFMPATHAIEACRKVAISGHSLASVSTEIVVLALFAAVLSVIAWLTLAWATSFVRRNGLRTY